MSASRKTSRPRLRIWPRMMRHSCKARQSSLMADGWASCELAPAFRGDRTAALQTRSVAQHAPEYLEILSVAVAAAALESRGPLGYLSGDIFDFCVFVQKIDDFLVQELGVNFFDAAFAVAQFLQKFLWRHVVGLGQSDDAEIQFLLVDANAFFLGDFGKDELSLHALFGGLIGRGV